MVLESNTLDVLFVKDGQQGEDGKVLYTWIKYAKDANGTGMTDDPNGAVYIGISYNNESSIESNDPTQYAWTKIQGADGKKGEDAYTIFLENENISFATDKNRNPLSEQAYTSGITIMKGAKPVTDFTIGDIAKTQGIAVAKTNTAIAISVVNGNPLPNDSGEIEIPITVSGTVFKKILTWSCAKKGEQGEKGERGLQGIQGPQGEQGIAGKDGTSVTITNKSITYQLSTSGTTIPTGTWQTTPQAIPEGQYQWTKTSVTYSDGNKTESYSISYHGKNGSDGTSVKTTSTSVKYQVGDSGTTKPTGTWQSNVPTVAQGKYLWTQTIVNYSDGNSTESYSVSYKGIDGSNGVNGMNAATIYLYQRATSTPSKPSNTLTYTFSTTKISGTLNNGWSTAIPTGTDAVYVTVASVSSKNDTATIATSAWSAPVVLAQNGKTGSDGKAGLNVATIYLYQRNTSKPSKPSASVTYTFSTGVASGLNNGWRQKIPDGTNPLYVTLATASSNTATDTILSSEWSDVVVMAQNGEDGQDGISPKVSLSKSGDTTTISIVDATGTHTQTVKDGTNGTPGAAGKDGKTSYFHVKYSNDGGKTFTANSGEDTGIYMGSYTDYTEADSTDVKKYNWVKVKGDKGDTGQKGKDGTSIKITSKSVTYQTSTSGTTAPTGTWSTTVPTVNNGQYLWTKTTVQYSDGNKTEAYSVSYKGTNGTNGTSVTVSKTEVTYQVSTSGTNAPTGTWSTTMPSCDQGQYLWTKTYVKYSDGKDTTSYSVSYKGVDGEKFAFNMLRETNQGSKHWVNMGASGKYSVESITTEDSINAVKLICTEPIASNEWQFCDFSDYEMLKSLKASTTYTLSYDIKTNRSGKILHNIKTGGGQKVFFANDIACKVLGNETWEHVSLKMTSGTTLPNLDGQVIYMFGDALSKVGYSIIKNLKLTEGIVDTPWAPHPEDLEGRGVTEITQWYLATNLSSGVTAGTSGWSTDITTQKITADKKYLWNCHRTKYSDGTMTLISTPAIIGVYGDKGDNAKNLSITPSSQYFKSTDGGKTFAPNAITIKPTIQGEISFGKWQYSIDGGVSFADVVSGQKGLTISNNVLTVSKDSSLYSDAVTMVTFRAVASDSGFYDTCSIAKIYDVSDIGDGRNLWITRDNITLQACEKDKYIYTTTGTSAVCIGADGSSVGTNTIALQTGTKYTISFVISSPSEVGYAQWYFCTALNSTGVKNYGGYGVKLVTGENIVSQTITVNTSCDAAGLVLYHLPTGCVIKDIQVEKGSSPTGWTPAPEDVQTAILSTKSEISSVSSKVDQNTKSIENRVEKTTYEKDLTLVKGDISKANEGLNKWRYEIYPKSLFASEYQGKSTMDVFAKNKNLTPSQSVLINDTDLSIAWNYDNNYIGYALTFAKFSAAKSVAITFAHDDGAHIYLNGKLIGGSDAYNQTGESLTLGFVKGWNCIEVVVNEGASTEGFKLGTTISAISECQLMNCYYGTPVARQSHITNQLVENTINIEGVSTKVGRVTNVIGENGENFTDFKNDYSDFKQTMNGFKTTVGQTYVTKDDFNGLEIGGRNLLLYSQTVRAHNDYYNVGWLTDEVETFNGCPVWSVKNQWGKLGWSFKSHVIDRGLVKVGDTLTYSLYAKTNNASGKRIACSYRFKGNAQGYWFNDSAFNVDTSWARYSVTFTVTKDMLATDTYMNEIGFGETASMSGDDKVYFACPKLERGTKATDYTEAPEDDKINGQNLVSNLPSNWEQGGINGGQAVGSTYASIKSSTTYRIRIKDIFSVSGNITVSVGGTTTNSAKETLSFYGTLYDTKKGLLRETGWKSFPSTINCGDAKYMSIILRWGDGTKTQIAPPDISQICLKIERGTSATPFTLAPEDVNGKIVNVETIANQTAKKFEWIVKSGDKSSSMVLTDDFLNIVANKINLTGKVTFNSFDKSTQDKLNSPTSGNLITVNPTNPTSNYGNTSFSVTADDAGGRCIQTTASFVPFTNYASNIFKPGEQIYYNINVPNWSSTTFNANLGIWFFTAEKKCVANSCVRVTLTRTTWNKLSGYITVPSSGWSGIVYYVIGIENPNKYQLGLVSNSYIEKTTSYASTYASSAVNWVTNNGSSTTNLNSMVKKWTDGAVSDTTQINGGWIKANTITASKIAVGDFTNYADVNESNTYGFTVEKTADGVWFSKDGSKLTRDNYISKMYSCEPGQTFYVEYDISNTIKDSTEYKAAGIMLFGCDGTQAVKWCQRRGAVVGTAAGTVTHMSQQLTMPSGTRFFYVVLQIEGHPPFTGTLKIRNLSVRKAVTGAVIVDGSITADKIATDAIKSRNYISSGGTQGSFLNLADGSFTSPNLSWDSNGNLIAKNANLSGEITATKGTIGGWSIISNSFFTKYNSSIDSYGTGISGDNNRYVLWAGEKNNAYGANRNSDTPTDATLRIWRNGAIEVQGNDNTTSGISHLYKILIQAGRINVGIDDHYIGSIAGSDTILNNQVINQHVSLTAHKGNGWSILHTNDSGNLICDIKRDPNTNGIKFFDDLCVSSGSNQIQLNAGNNGSIELYGGTPFIDFHYGSSTSDYTSRIIAQSGWDCLNFTGSILLGADLYANGYIYNSSGGHYTWNGRTDAYISCGNYNNTNNIYYYAGYHAFYVNGDSGSGMMYIETSGVSSRKGFRNSSDERIKQNFSHFDDNFIDTYMNLEPVQYQFKNDTSDKYHFGFKAQQTERILNAYGQESDKSYGICATHAINPEKAEKLYGVKDMHEEYTLAYDELIAPTTYMVQHTYKELESTKNELTKVKQEKADLEARLQAIEAKLGL